MIQLLQAAIDSTKTTASLKESPSYWMWIALGELMIILFLIAKWKTHSKDAQAKQKFKSEALHGEIDFDNVITSSFHANELYDKLKKTCHPDRFTNEEQRVIADQLFQQITQNRRDYKKLVELQHEAENKLHIHPIIIPEEMKNILLTLGAILCFWACQPATSTYQGPSRGHHFASEAGEEGYINEIFDIDVLISCAMSLKNEIPSRLTYGCLCTIANGESENYWISADWGTTIEDATPKEYVQQAKGVIATQFNNVKEMNFQNLPALLYDQREGATLIRHLNFWYKGNVYDVKFASFPSDDFDMRASDFFNRITLK